MNDQSDPNYWLRELEKRNQAQLDACPEPARRALRSVQEAQDRVGKAITTRTWFEHQLAQIGAGKDPAPYSLTQYEQGREDAEGEFERSKSALDRAVAAYKRRIVALRLENVPGRSRQVALDLLAEEAAAIEAACASTSLSSGEYGAAGGEFFGLEGRMMDAVRSGETEVIEQLKPLLEAARAKKEAAESEMNELQRRVEQIKAECDRRLAILGNR